MSVILRNVQIPLFIKIETGCLGRIQSIIDENHLQFRKPLIVSEEHILNAGGNAVVHALGERPGIILTNDNSITKANDIIAEVRSKGNDLIVGIGGGRVLDLVKYVGTKTQTNYISVPTTPSNDGLCSPVAVLKNDELTESLPVNMPIGILVDTAMMTHLPEQLVRSGIGDLISNFSAIHDWRLAAADNGEPIDDFAASIAYSAAQLIFETCTNGAPSGSGVAIDLHNEAFLGKLVHGLILSGIAMNIAGSSRPASGSEHELSHALDSLFPGRSSHGLQVAFGTLLCGYLRGEDIGELLGFFRVTGLPITMQELGFDSEELAAAIELAPSTRPDRYTVLEQKQLKPKQIDQLIRDYHDFISNASI